MFNGSNCDRMSQLSGVLAEPLNPRDINVSGVLAAPLNPLDINVYVCKFI